MSPARRLLTEDRPPLAAGERLPGHVEFPQLAEIADAARLTESLRRALADARPASPPLAGCRVRKLHYRPGSGCRLVLEARFTTRGGRREEQLYFGSLLPEGGERRDIRRGRQAPSAAPRFGPPELELAGWRLHLRAYPNDPDLPGLAFLGDPDRVRERLAATPAAFGLAAAPASVVLRRAKYVPGRRGGYLVHARPGRARRGTAHRLYAKCYAGDEAARVHALALRMWASPARVAGALVLPEPYALDREAGIVWQEGFAGRPLLKQRGRRPALDALAPEIGERLAALHGSPLGLPVEMTLGSHADMLRRSLAAAAAIPSGHARSARELGEHLLLLAARFGELPPVTLHGSFRLSHVMATRRGLAFIDLDGANAGDPAVDLGRFVAHVLKLAAAGSLEPALGHRVVDGFCRGYAARAATPVGEERIRWAAAVHLVSGGLDKAMKRLDAGALDAITRAAARMCPL